jgi:hypothetical protein
VISYVFCVFSSTTCCVVVLFVHCPFLLFIMTSFSSILSVALPGPLLAFCCVYFLCCCTPVPSPYPYPSLDWYAYVYVCYRKPRVPRCREAVELLPRQEVLRLRRVHGSGGLLLRLPRRRGHRLVANRRWRPVSNLILRGKTHWETYLIVTVVATCWQWVSWVAYPGISFVC